MSSLPDLTLIEARTHDRAPSRPPDASQSPTVKALREARLRLTSVSLRRLRERLFKLQLELLEELAAGDISIPKVTAVSHCARTLEVVERLQVTARSR
jgi:hypothetical protein